jgi:hypothetical protein
MLTIVETGGSTGRLTPEGGALFASEVERWLGRLGMTDWNVRIWDANLDDGHYQVNVKGARAWINVAREWNVAYNNEESIGAFALEAVLKILLHRVEDDEVRDRAINRFHKVLSARRSG